MILNQDDVGRWYWTCGFCGEKATGRWYSSHTIYAISQDYKQHVKEKH